MHLNGYWFIQCNLFIYLLNTYIEILIQTNLIVIVI